MDLGSILNVDDKSKASNQTYTRTLYNGHHGGSASSRTVGRPITSSIKAGPIRSPVLSAYASKNISSLSKAPWTQENSPLKTTSSNLSSSGRITANRRPRINTSTKSLSESVRRGTSGNSPGSQCSPSRTPPSPSTPSSTTSINRGLGSLSYSRDVLHKPVSSCGIRRSETSKTFPDSYHACQPHATPSMISNMSHANHAVNQSYPHLNRVLPLPVTRGPSTLSAPLPSPIRPQISPISPSTSTPSPKQKCPQSSSQRVCSAITNCDYSTPKRRIVSQFFGRNKKETRLIPRHCWIYYCRQHYQRLRYRLTAARFAEMQMSLVRATITALDSESIVTSWEVKLRKRVLEKLTKSGSNGWESHKSSSSSSSSNKKAAVAAAAAGKSSGPGAAIIGSASGAGGAGEAREKLLLPYCGAGKSFKQVYEILNLVDEICRRDGGPALEFEILPSFTTDWVREEENRRRMNRVDGSASGSESSDDE